MSGLATRVGLAVFVALIVDGMDLQMLSLALPSITKELHLPGVKAGALATYTLFGMGIGGVIAGLLADRVGRVRVTWWSILLFTCGTCMIGLCRTYGEVALARFVSGLGLGSVYSIGTLLVAEYVPTRVRGTAVGALQAGWSVGYIAAAITSAYVVPAFGWRALFFCAIGPGVLALVILGGIPDAPGFVAARKRAADAPRRANEFARLWADGLGRRMLILWSLTSIALQFGYYGANTWLPTYLVKDMGLDIQNMGWYVATTYFMMVVGKVAAGCLADVIGRRAIWALAGIVTAVYLPLMMFIATPTNVAYLLLVFGLLYGAPYAVNATYLSETFSASFRGTAVATAHAIGRIGSMLSPLLIGSVSATYSVGFGIGLLGVAYAVAGLIPGIFIREGMFDPTAADGGARAVPRDEGLPRVSATASR